MGKLRSASDELRTDADIARVVATRQRGLHVVFCGVPDVIEAVKCLRKCHVAGVTLVCTSHLYFSTTTEHSDGVLLKSVVIDVNMGLNDDDEDDGGVSCPPLILLRPSPPCLSLAIAFLVLFFHPWHCAHRCVGKTNKHI